MSWFRTIAAAACGLTLGVACAARTPARVEPGGAGERRVVSVQPDPEQRPSMVVLQWRGSFARAGELFAVIDESGYRGLVRTVAPARADCDHCPGPLIEAEIVEGKGPGGTGAIAFGPVSGSVPRARMERVPRGGVHELEAEWRPVLHVDLDGDGRRDFDEVERCGATSPSGCASAVCKMVCSAVTPSGQVPDTRFIECVSFIPDAEDCTPQP